MIGLTRSEEHIYYSTPPYQRRTIQTMGDEAYEELKKILILAGIFFMATIVMVMSKLQIPADDVFRWSPIVWLVGVVMAGGLWNLLVYCKKMIRIRRAKRTGQDDRLLSLPLPSSFPCLAPPPHEGCCREPRGTQQTQDKLPTYEQLHKAPSVLTLSAPPDYSSACEMLERAHKEERVETVRDKNTDTPIIS